jgi:hypothetical protein
MEMLIIQISEQSAPKVNEDAKILKDLVLHFTCKGKI